MTSIHNLTEMAVNYWAKFIYPANQPMMDMNTTYFNVDLNHQRPFSVSLPANSLPRRRFLARHAILPNKRQEERVTKH